MDDPSVYIYIFARPRAPRAKNIDYKYILAYRGKTSSGKGCCEDSTYNRTVLTALIAALERMKQSKLITINTDCRYLVDGHHQMRKWFGNGWRRNNGQQLKNLDLWKKIYELEARQVGVRCSLDNVEMIFKEDENEKVFHGYV